MDREKLPKVLRRYADIISDFSDERSMGDGYWVYFVPGWIWQKETHQVHEDNPRDCAREIKDFVTPCDCDDCKHEAARSA